MTETADVLTVADVNAVRQTSALFIRQFAERINALAIGLVVYEPRVDDEESEYEQPPVPKFFPVSKFDEMLAKLTDDSDDGLEVGIVSRFINYLGDEQHFRFGDMANGAARPECGHPVASSEPREGFSARFHFYQEATYSDFHRMQAELLLVPGIDVRWISAGLFNGFNILRLTARNTERFNAVPYLINPVAIDG